MEQYLRFFLVSTFLIIIVYVGEKKTIANPLNRVEATAEQDNGIADHGGERCARKPLFEKIPGCVNPAVKGLVQHSQIESHICRMEDSSGHCLNHGKWNEVEIDDGENQYAGTNCFREGVSLHLSGSHTVFNNSINGINCYKNETIVRIVPVKSLSLSVQVRLDYSQYYRFSLIELKGEVRSTDGVKEPYFLKSKIKTEKCTKDGVHSVMNCDFPSIVAQLPHVTNFSKVPGLLVNLEIHGKQTSQLWKMFYKNSEILGAIHDIQFPEQRRPMEKSETDEEKTEEQPLSFSPGQRVNNDDKDGKVGKKDPTAKPAYPSPSLFVRANYLPTFLNLNTRKRFNDVCDTISGTGKKAYDSVGDTISETREKIDDLFDLPSFEGLS